MHRPPGAMILEPSHLHTNGHVGTAALGSIRSGSEPGKELLVILKPYEDDDHEPIEDEDDDHRVGIELGCPSAVK